ncbi:hypothetical protein MOK15_13665 [Sphingobium sp. BYY-5]|uniref:hypothetical protein n=1 Tax=Sphingobium sp. BYY-5 TaxID=2926400 RepID=UPI001FA727BF|nr:hypothetical protein [Sphingobium sp. BYY-5]MCI4591134.1 hypothetical protein [Sphingobium sp. BYY-5]
MIGIKARWITGALVSVGLLLGSVGAAQAQPGWGGGRGWDRGWDRHRHRGNGFGVGDAIGVAALVGAVAIVASSMSKDKKAQGARTDRGYGDDYDAPPPSADTDYGADVRNDAPTRDDADFSDVAGSGSGDDAQNDTMTNACAVAIRDQAQREDGYAEIRQMGIPTATEGGGYNIDGEVETRASYRATNSDTRRFTCAMKDGRVAEAYLSRDLVAQ